MNYRVDCYKRANEPIFEISKPYGAGHGWTRTKENLVDLLLSVGPILPHTLVNLLEAGVCEEEEEEGENNNNTS